MKEAEIQSRIASAFRKQVQNDKKIESACLLVQSDKLNINLHIAEGSMGNTKAHISQPNHMASVGKLFTSTIISILYERGLLDFNDSIGKYLDAELIKGLHVYKGKDYSDEITIRQLLMQTSGLNDVFYHLMKRMQENPSFSTTPREAIIWGKQNLKPVAVPGKKHFYTDTNYYLLGLIVENITRKKFHEVMHEFIFEPVGMQHAFMYGFSEPKLKSVYPVADLYFKDVNLLSINGIHQLDYAGGSVVAPLEEFLMFMKSLLGQKLIKQETLNRMIDDDISMGFPIIGFNYGYAVWKLKTIPLIMPKKYNCWGCVGVTGAFMFHHPATRSNIIGTFNDFSYRGKGLQFMAGKIIKVLLKHEK